MKLLENIDDGSYMYKIGHTCGVISILDDFLAGNKIASSEEIRYMLDGFIFDKNTQEYNSPFIVNESQIENTNNDPIFYKYFKK